jgi:eukaryotic-like serine/threonine-protein kinase
MKYVLSPLFEILQPSEIDSVTSLSDSPIDNTLLKKIKNEELFFLFSSNDSSYLIINPSIKSFLELLSVACSFSELVLKLSKSADCSEEIASPVAKEFFNDMYNRGIIISQTKLKNILKKANENTHSESDKFLHYTIIKNLKNEPNHYNHIYLVKNSINDELDVLKRLILPFSMLKKEKNYWKSMFSQEFEIMQEIGYNPNICCLKELNTEGGYAILEYINGEDLRTYLALAKPALGDKFKIITQILKAMAGVHSKMVLHGDIHASNFMVTLEGVVKLIDFDLANRELPLRHEWINEGGVFEYIPPEKINKSSFEIIKERSDYRSEVYQLGIIIYIIIFNKLPFEALTWHELTDKILKEEPRFSTDTASIIPQNVINFLNKSLDKNPENRFENAQSMLIAWYEISPSV